MVLLSGPLIILALLIRIFFLEPFNIPSSAMTPSLLIGDYLFVSKISYGYSRFSLPFSPPLFSGRIFASYPERGDVAVFRLPTDTSINYIKRVVGLPGDKIQMIHGNLFINGQMAPRRQVEDYAYGFDGRVTRMSQYIETLPRGPGEPPLEHRILKIGDDGPLDNTPVYEVPSGDYFVLGDNRDNSQDSRAMTAVGFIPAENFIGPALVIFYSTDGATIRSDRILKAVH